MVPDLDFGLPMFRKTSCNKNIVSILAAAAGAGAATAVVVSVVLNTFWQNNTQPNATILIDKPSSSSRTATGEVGKMLINKPSSTLQVTSKEVANAHITQDDGLLAPVSYGHIPAVVRAVLSEGDTVVKSFQATGSLTAWVVHSSDHPSDAVVLYTLDDDRVLVHGRVFSMNDNAKKQDQMIEHSGEYAQRYKPVIDFEAQWDRIVNSYWFADGASNDKATRVVYGFFDANCIYCHLAWLALEPYMEKGLQVRWIPVAIIGQDSDVKAAAIVQASVASDAMRAGHRQWEQGGFPAAELVPDNVRDGLDANLLLMRSLGVKGTPAFFYKDAEERIQSVGGMPRLSQAAEMAGMVEVENSNPKLQRFR